MDSLNASAITDTRLGKHELGFFTQDNWKVTRKLSLELGLRWDYTTLLEEEHGRMQSANFQCPNPNLIPANSTTPLNGLVVYQKQFNKNYPFAFGPRLGVAYQIDSKTVFRAGGGIAYANSGGNAGLSGTDADFFGSLAPEGTGQTLGGVAEPAWDTSPHATGARARSTSGMEIRLLPATSMAMGHSRPR